MGLRGRLRVVGLTVPAAPPMPAATMFSRFRTCGDRVPVSDHGSHFPDRQPAGPFRRVPATEVPGGGTGIGTAGRAAPGRRRGCTADQSHDRRDRRSPVTRAGLMRGAAFVARLTMA